MEKTLHEDVLKKEEEKERWVEYWAVLRNSVMYFYESPTDAWEDYCDKIKITASARCFTVKRRTYSHRFKLVTTEGVWLLKCHTNLQRHRWMHMIERAAKEISPEATHTSPVPLPSKSRYDGDVLGVRLRKEMRLNEMARTDNNTPEEASLNFEQRNASDQELEARQSSNVFKRKTFPPQRKQTQRAPCDALKSEFINPEENLAFSDDDVNLDEKTKD